MFFYNLSSQEAEQSRDTDEVSSTLFLLGVLGVPVLPYSMFQNNNIPISWILFKKVCIRMSAKKINYKLLMGGSTIANPKKDLQS